MILIIDVGNTRAKAAVFEQDSVLEWFVFETKELSKKITELLVRFPKIHAIVVASVVHTPKEAFLDAANGVAVFFISRTDHFPFNNHYASPQTLGIDRMVLASGATLQFPGQNRLVIDAGTCITYDFIDAQDNYLGGAISPGLRLRYQALHQHTSQLPLLSLSDPDGFVGTTTDSSIHSGVVNGLVYEIDGFIAEYKALDSNFIIILTGGDTEFLAKRLKNTIFANSNFLLESLYQTFQYKIKND
ncbi:type III pantothenate kinase [Flavobacterium crassostreae]|uniref:Type III pantothenate kinase n=1 Tax=Flavobacterium crassostreae TaxID=1763534 RepID=A0A1B9E000_9FLAO|nr:type III pantothenate kinase [Flavobacterium crassostreae]OCB75238.1 type III pantothenate kinase [Flavobacterium crassostreae]